MLSLSSHLFWVFALLFVQSLKGKWLVQLMRSKSRRLRKTYEMVVFEGMHTAHPISCINGSLWFGRFFSDSIGLEEHENLCRALWGGENSLFIISLVDKRHCSTKEVSTPQLCFRKVIRKRSPNIGAKSQLRLHSLILMKYSISAGYFLPQMLIKISPTRQVKGLRD